MVTSLLYPIIGTCILILLSGNAFFIKRLIDKIELTSNAQASTSLNVGHLSDGLAQIGRKLEDIKEDIKDLRRIEIDVAVLKTQINPVKGT